MDAKQVQLVLAGLVGIGLAVALADLVAARARAFRTAQWRNPGTILTGLGAIAFLVLAAVAAQPHEGWQPARPADAGWGWAWWIVPAAAAMLAAWAILGAVRPRHAAALLVFSAALIPALEIVAAIANGAPASGDEPDPAMIVGLTAVAFSLPAAGAGFAFIGDQGVTKPSH